MINVEIWTNYFLGVQKTVIQDYFKEVKIFKTAHKILSYS